MINSIITPIVFYSSLAVCIVLGGQYKQNSGYEMKRNYGTGLGIIVACLICGSRIFYTIVMVWGNVVILKFCDKHRIHFISLIWTWLCLIYIHINLTEEKYVIWLHQNVALRLVGLTFELHLDKKSNVSKLALGDSESVPEPTSMDIVSYAFFFIGLHKGPYYKWKILNDHLNGSFGLLGDCRIITKQKLKKVATCVIVHTLLSYRYSPKIYYDNNFYKDYDMDTRYIYNIPLLLMYYLRMQIVMLLCTSVCTEAGFGVYPVKCQSTPGQGPSARYSLLKLVNEPSKALDQEYNFTMLKCFDSAKIVTGPRMTDTVRSWDMPTQYWFSTYISKNLFHKTNKEVRGIISFLSWTLWKGASLQQLLVSSTLWLYIHLESEYDKLYCSDGSMMTAWNIGFSIMRMFCLIYLTPCFMVDDAFIVLQYYNSIFWIYHILMLISILVAIGIYKSRQY